MVVARLLLLLLLLLLLGLLVHNAQASKGLLGRRRQRLTAKGLPIREAARRLSQLFDQSVTRRGATMSCLVTISAATLCAAVW